MGRFPHLGAFESTKIYGSGQDVLGTTRHTEFWREGLEMLHSAGIRELRYPVPWHRIESVPGEFDWRWLDGPMQWMRQLQLQPILDPLHHVSFPDWLDNGFANGRFPELYARFVEQVAQRYEWVDRYTLVNEPLPTLVLCGLTGDWYPYKRSDQDFICMALNVARALCLAAAAVQKVREGVQLIHVDSCESHRALDQHSVDWVNHANHRRFLIHDLVLGQVDKDHPLRPYLHMGGFGIDQERWFQEHAIHLDVLGLDYYAHSEIEWQWNSASQSAALRFPCQRPRGFKEVALDYVQRFGRPVLLTETNVGGSLTDRLTWLKYMQEQAEELAAVADFRGFCWFPSIDATDWDSLCTVANQRVSPVGIWALGKDRRKRESSELSRWYTRLANGTADSHHLPAYHLKAPLDRDLQGYFPVLEGNPKLDTTHQETLLPVA